MLYYYLLDNPITDDPTDFRGQTVSQGTKTDEDIVDYMIARGSTVTRAEAGANLQECGDAIASFLKDGYNVNSRLLRAGFSISGVFTSEDDSFDKSRHQVNINVQLGNGMKDIASQVKVAKTEGNPAQPLPKTLLDVGSNTTNEKLTPGGTVKVTGRRMKIDPTETTQGVYLVNGTKTVPVTTFITNRPSELVLQLPATLAKGQYTLEVRGTVNGAERTGRLDAPLTV